MENISLEILKELKVLNSKTGRIETHLKDIKGQGECNSIKDIYNKLDEVAVSRSYNPIYEICDKLDEVCNKLDEVKEVTIEAKGERSYNPIYEVCDKLDEVCNKLDEVREVTIESKADRSNYLAYEIFNKLTEVIEGVEVMLLEVKGYGEYNSISDVCSKLEEIVKRGIV